MIVYHGTTKSSALKIIKDGEIKNRCERVWDFEAVLASGEKKSIKTTDGFVYLSDKFSLAAFYGNSARIRLNNGEQSYFVFRVDIPENELRQDADELTMNHEIINPHMTAQESLDICHCVTVDYSINKNVYSIEYMEVSIEDCDSEVFGVVMELLRHKNDMQEDPMELISKLEISAKWERLK